MLQLTKTATYSYNPMIANSKHLIASRCSISCSSWKDSDPRLQESVTGELVEVESILRSDVDTLRPERISGGGLTPRPKIITVRVP